MRHTEKITWFTPDEPPQEGTDELMVIDSDDTVHFDCRYVYGEFKRREYIVDERDICWLTIDEVDVWALSPSGPRELNA
jgi:hypothetical protein